jgi:acyl-CoA synthetase (AMP-forming)/AMP-acid ligase II
VSTVRDDAATTTCPICSQAFVAGAATFAMPHDKVGEEVGAAVVERKDAHVTEREVRAYLAERLAPSKGHGTSPS